MVATTLVILLVLLVGAVAASPVVDGGCKGCYTSMFSFGDSMTDTGNYLTSVTGEFTHVGVLPYGETFFHRPTGRYSDGRIIIDFLAEAFGLPYLPPYLEGPPAGGNGFRRGANFAFAGATALDGEFFLDRGEGRVFTNNSLRVQTRWFRELLPSLCFSPNDCKEFLRRAVFVVGEIGGNDYNHPLRDGMPFHEVKTFIPKVIKSVMASVNELIEIGARTLVVPGTFPLGCMPTHLTEFPSPNDYDFDTGCIKRFNRIAEFHNRYLQRELQRVRSRNPHVTIIYADYYGSVMNILRSPGRFGFYDRTPRSPRACCGGGGPYNYVASRDCGCDGTSACADPSQYVYWDGYHLTEAANKIVAETLLEGPYAFPPITETCLPALMPVDSSLPSRIA